jgi:hypothetical protein
MTNQQSLSDDEVDALIGEVAQLLEVCNLLAYVAQRSSVEQVPEIVRGALAAGRDLL